jgi:hypothetical protein
MPTGLDSFFMIRFGSIVSHALCYPWYVNKEVWKGTLSLPMIVCVFAALHPCGHMCTHVNTYGSFSFDSKKGILVLGP